MSASKTANPVSIEALRELARKRDDASREQLIVQLTDQFVDRTEAREQATSEVFGEIVCNVLQKVGVATRVKLSEKVAPLEQMPREIILQLAADELEVATIVLEKSPVLTDTDLITIADGAIRAQVVAISKRENLRARVTSHLVTSEDAEVLRVLADNLGARFSDKSFRVLAQRAKSDANILDRLVDRQDLTPAITVQIAPFLSEEMKARRGMANEEPSISLLDSLDDLKAEAKAAPRSVNDVQAVQTLLAQVRDGALNASEAVTDLADREKFDAVVLFLAERAELPKKSVRAMMLNINGGPISIVCKALQLERFAFDAISHLRCEAMNMPQSDLIIQADGYETLKAKEAHKTLVAMRKKAATPR